MPKDVNLQCKITVRRKGRDGWIAYSYLHFPAVWAPGQRPVCELCPLKSQRERHVTFSFSQKPTCLFVKLSAIIMTKHTSTNSTSITFTVIRIHLNSKFKYQCCCCCLHLQSEFLKCYIKR